MSRHTDEQYTEALNRAWGSHWDSDEQLDIDPVDDYRARVETLEGGAWVLAWVFVSDELVTDLQKLKEEAK